VVDVHVLEVHVGSVELVEATNLAVEGVAKRTAVDGGHETVAAVRSVVRGVLRVRLGVCDVAGVLAGVRVAVLGVLDDVLDWNGVVHVGGVDRGGVGVTTVLVVGVGLSAVWGHHDEQGVGHSIHVSHGKNEPVRESARGVDVLDEPVTLLDLVKHLFE